MVFMLSERMSINDASLPDERMILCGVVTVLERCYLEAWKWGVGWGHAAFTRSVD
jgi:hypothetical protein